MKTREEIKEYNFNYNRSEHGKINRLFGDMKSRSKKRGMNLPNFTKEELETWLYKNNYKELFEDWKKSGFDKMKSPSVDRLDDYKPYTFDNMRLVTWKVNEQKGNDDMKNGINNKNSKSINQIDLITGEIINEFYSMSQAFRETKVSQGVICLCCKNERKSAGGFIWKYA